MSDFDDILDDLFHGCAFAAYLEEAAKVGGPPGEETTRRRAYQLFEEALAEKNGRTKTQADAIKSVEPAFLVSEST